MKKIITGLFILSFSFMLNSQTKKAGTIIKISGSEITVKNENAQKPFQMGENLRLLTGDKSVVLQVIFAMQTSAKCKIISGSIASLRINALVYTGGINSESVKTEIKAENSQTGNKKPMILPTEFFINPKNGHKYFITKMAKWKDAEKEAVEAGGHLVTIRSNSEERWIRDTFGMHQDFWIGLKRDSSTWTSNKWIWTSGEEVIYLNWGSGQPDNKGGQNVACICSGSYSWDDAWETLELRGIAEIKTN